MTLPLLPAVALALAALLGGSSPANAANLSNDGVGDQERRIQPEIPDRTDRGGWSGWDWLQECLEESDHEPPPECDRPQIFDNDSEWHPE